MIAEVRVVSCSELVHEIAKAIVRVTVTTGSTLRACRRQEGAKRYAKAGNGATTGDPGGHNDHEGQVSGHIFVCVSSPGPARRRGRLSYR